jgi:hypothetical protein
MKLSRRPPPRHVELFTTADNVKILPELHGQRLSNPENRPLVQFEVPPAAVRRNRVSAELQTKNKNGAERIPRRQ